MDMSPENMRRQFHQKRAQREAILAVSLPQREARDAFSQEADTKLRAMNAEIKAAEEGLFDLDMEISALSRALKGQVGDPADFA